MQHTAAVRHMNSLVSLPLPAELLPHSNPPLAQMFVLAVNFWKAIRIYMRINDIYHLITTHKNTEGELGEPSPPARQGQAAPQRST